MVHSTFNILIKEPLSRMLLGKYGLYPIWEPKFLHPEERYAGIEQSMRDRHAEQLQIETQLVRLHDRVHSLNFSQMHVRLAQRDALTTLDALNHRLECQRADVRLRENYWSQQGSITGVKNGQHAEHCTYIRGFGSQHDKTIIVFNTLQLTRFYAGFKPGSPIFRFQYEQPPLVAPTTGRTANGVPVDFHHRGLLPQESLEMCPDDTHKGSFVYEGRVPRSTAETLARISQLVPDVVIMIATVYITANPNLEAFFMPLLEGARQRDPRTVSHNNLVILLALLVLMKEYNVQISRCITAAFAQHPRVTELSALLAQEPMKGLIPPLLPLVNVIECMTGYSMYLLAELDHETNRKMAVDQVWKKGDVEGVFFHADPKVSCPLLVFFCCPRSPSPCCPPFIPCHRQKPRQDRADKAQKT